jgi:hypothetical protein
VSESRLAVRNADLRRLIKKYIAEWRPILRLADWDLEIRILNGGKEFIDFDGKELEGYCEAKPRYEEAKLGYNLRLIKKKAMTEEQVEELTLHEMVHAVIWKNGERNVNKMTRALLECKRRGQPQ